MNRTNLSKFLRQQPVEERKTELERGSSIAGIPQSVTLTRNNLLAAKRNEESFSNSIQPSSVANDSLDDTVFSDDIDDDNCTLAQMDEEDIESHDGDEGDTNNEVMDNDDVSVLSTISAVSRTSTITTRKSDIALQMQAVDIGVEELNNFDCNKTNRCCFGGNCTRRLTVASIAAARKEFWGESSQKLCTKERGEKIFSLMLNAKNVDNGNSRKGRNGIVFKFELENIFRKSSQDKLYVCEGMSYVLDIYSASFKAVTVLLNDRKYETSVGHIKNQAVEKS